MDFQSFRVLFLLVNIYESWANPPSFIPSNEIIDSFEDSTLELKCTGQKNVTFIYASDTSCSYYMSEPAKENEYKCSSQKPIITYEFDGEKYLALFRRERVIFQETGWYGCIESDKLVAEGWNGLEWIGLTPDHFNKSDDVSWTYVYIMSPFRPGFVEAPPASYVYTLYEKVGNDVYFSCRATLGYSRIKLIKRGKIVSNSIRESKRGFTLKNVADADSGNYTCRNSLGYWERTSVQYVLIVTDKNSNLYNPVIINNSPEPIIPGQTLKLKCSVDTPHGHLYLLRWKIPKQSNRVSYNYFEVQNDKHSFTYTSELIISGVTNEDEGVYECEYVAPQLKKQNSYKINITIDNKSLADHNEIDASLNYF
ncbi:hypothetical protein KQX54_006561 [Cotesia glomerata]|uniref:Platelet-derived growth factor receptor-like protein n=2 Tax=Cotesia glomerata TaxID=32391 RepID=A0AAV7ILQ6_COTGL|nr:hypothetical protein KQX54_006561 [Cotesia glomerata]